MTSNSAESLNALSAQARRLPITMFLEFFRASLQQWFYEKSVFAEGLAHSLTPYAEHKIGKRLNRSLRWGVNPVTKRISEVTDGRKNGTVDLDERTCTCGQWQLSGLPCGHVIATARRYHQNDVSCYAEKYFTVETYRAAYAEPIYPIGHPSEWIDPGNLQTVFPPDIVKKQAGRPPGRARIPSKNEEAKIVKRQCSRCHEYGHSRATCRSFDDKTQQSGQPSQSSKSKGKKKQDDWSQQTTVNLGYP